MPIQIAPTTPDNTTPIGMTAHARRVGQFGRVPDAALVTHADLAEHIREFSSIITAHLEQLRAGFTAARETSPVDFTRRHTLAARRDRLELDIHLDDDGTVDPAKGDGHCQMGVTLGWISQANKQASAIIERAIFEEQRLPVSCAPRGTRDENETMTRIFEETTADLLRQARFRDHGKILTNQLPKYGTAVLRYETLTRTRYAKNIQGAFEETAPEIIPSITAWPLQDVLISHPSKPHAADQHGVFWITPRCTMPDLEAREEILSDHGSYGRFVNLETIRQIVANWQTTGSDNTGLFPRATLVEWEGPLPFPAWQKQGKLSWEVMTFFGAHVADAEPDPNSELQMEEYARRLARIPIWQVAYIRDWDSAVSFPSTHNGNDILLCLRPAPQRAPRSSLYAFRYLDSDGFYGLSTTDRGEKLQKAGDLLHNAALYIDWKNSHPSVLMDTSGLTDDDLAQAESLLRLPDRILQIKPGASASNVAHFISLPQVQNLDGRISAHKTELENLTGITAAAKGQQTSLSTNTFSELQLQEQKSTLLMASTILAAGREISRLCLDMFADWIELHEDPATPDLDQRHQRFIDYAARITGLPASKIAEILPALDDIRQELDVTPPSVMGSERTVIAQQMLQLFQVTGGAAFPDIGKFAAKYLQTVGITKGEDILGVAAEMDPADEENQLQQGNWINPREREDLMRHMTQHTATLRALEDEAYNRPMTDEEMLFAGMLAKHVKRTMEIMQLAMAQAQAQAQMAAPPQAAPGGGRPQAATAPTTGGPRTSQAIASDIQGNAASAPAAPAQPGGAK